ncbi:MAG: NAD(P)-dependent oxidoreductase [Saprospiraceae bacterium]|nr:NAD(P)-dependent oxidoreductase [Saprospiraceae bacterium]
MIKIGVIREGKVPPDSRVPLNPKQCKQLSDMGVDIVVQPSPIRCFSDEDYKQEGIRLKEDMSDRDVLLGVKEVPIDQLVADKIYFFFSHTIKKQVYNRKLLKHIFDANITLIDYEVLTDEKGARVIAFGKFAGMVGAHNALWTYGKRTGQFELPRMKDIYDYDAAKEVYSKVDIPNVKIALTGTGRVAGGAAMVLEDMGIQKISPMEFLCQDADGPVFTQLNSFFYAKRKDGKVFDTAIDFYTHPKEYKNDFHHFLPKTDILINGVYWDNDAPPFFTLNDLKSDTFNIKVIADVTCDIAPVSSIPTTIKASTIADPVFGFERMTNKETKPYGENVVDMMTIDNLPNELPRDASTAFGDMFISNVLNELGNRKSPLIERATIATGRNLGKHFEYLRDYLNG